MSSLIPVYLNEATFKKLQQLAVLAGDESAAVERLIAYWESGKSGLASADGAAKAVEVWRSAGGDVLRVGLQLEATDAGQTHYATVEPGGLRYAGQLYESPSAAAKAVKERRGLTGAAANTNGREFWKLRDPKTNRLVPISALRPAQRIDSDALLAELEAMK